MKDKKLTYSQARGMAGLTQTEMAKKLHVTVATISNIENYKSSPSVLLFDMFCKACDVNRDDIQVRK